MHGFCCIPARDLACLADLQAWQQAGGSIDWCRDLGVDGRSMRFARDIRQQLARIIGERGMGWGWRLAQRALSGRAVKVWCLGTQHAAGLFAAPPELHHLCSLDLGAKMHAHVVKHSSEP